MSTFADLISETHMVLTGFTQRQDQATYLSANMAIGDLTFTVQDGTVLTRGMVEIDDELIWVDRFDRTTNIATVAPYGRGFRGTTAVAHTSGTRITIAPSFPRSIIERNINAAIDAVYPDLFGTATTTFPFTAARTTYPLPADAIDILAISWQTIGPSKEWLPVRHYRVDRMADPTTWATGKTISVSDGIIPGRTVTIRYSNKPIVLANQSDVFESVSGLPASAREVIVLGAAYRTSVYLDLGRITARVAEADAQGTANPIGAAVNISRVLKNMYQDRLMVEVRKQQEQFPPRVHISR
jgi:hypothetical protein